ncbi:MAG TPA: TIGR00153 family protein [Thermotogota bacterium]|nr:TIGR00153 family protein [Thermotogota bacterium]HRW92455.1 TIGR00153 family protein [Thermotogota bacterium]
MNFFGKKELTIIQLFEEHLASVDSTVQKLIELIANLGEEPKFLMKRAEEVRQAESQADEKRRNLESEMYLGAFLPNFRGDLLGIVEGMDVVANKAEAIADSIDLQQIQVPPELIPDLVQLVKISHETFLASSKAASTMFNNLDKANDLVKEAEAKEHEGDEVERALIRKLFQMELELAHKLQLKSLVKKISDIADHSENVSDRIQIVVFKRRV